MIMSLAKFTQRFEEEGRFVLVYNENWVRGARVPDMMFITGKASRWCWRRTSPNDSYTAVYDKVATYRRDGVQLVWVIDPQRASVSVHIPGSPQQNNLTGQDTLTGGTVLPDFALSLVDLFAGLI